MNYIYSFEEYKNINIYIVAAAGPRKLITLHQGRCNDIIVLFALFTRQSGDLWCINANHTSHLLRTITKPGSLATSVYGYWEGIHRYGRQFSHERYMTVHIWFSDQGRWDSWRIPAIINSAYCTLRKWEGIRALKSGKRALLKPSHIRSLCTIQVNPQWIMSEK
jgi:hypothetical protein